jgi:hypothetical protein
MGLPHIKSEKSWAGVLIREDALSPHGGSYKNHDGYHGEKYQAQQPEVIEECL